MFKNFIDNVKKNYNRFKYTSKHWLWFQIIAFRLHHWRPHYIFHDVDKLVMFALLFNTKFVSKFHRKYARHHRKVLHTDYGDQEYISDIYQAVIDWECARFSKPDKPMNARETYKAYFSKVDGVEQVLNKLKL